MMNQPENSRQAFETTDLNLASFLRSRSFEIADIKRQNSKTIFVFDDSPRLRQAILDFANDGAVGVRSFCNTMRDLKAITR